MVSCMSKNRSALISLCTGAPLGTPGNRSIVRADPSLKSGVCNPLDPAPVGRGGYGEHDLGLGVRGSALRWACPTRCAFSSRKSRGEGSPLPSCAEGEPEAAMYALSCASCDRKSRGQGPPLPFGVKGTPDAAKRSVARALFPSPPGWLETLGYSI